MFESYLAGAALLTFAGVEPISPPEVCYLEIDTLCVYNSNLNIDLKKTKHEVRLVLSREEWISGGYEILKKGRCENLKNVKYDIQEQSEKYTLNIIFGNSCSIVATLKSRDHFSSFMTNIKFFDHYKKESLYFYQIFSEHDTKRLNKFFR